MTGKSSIGSAIEGRYPFSQARIEWVFLSKAGASGASGVSVASGASGACGARSPC